MIQTGFSNFSFLSSAELSSLSESLGGKSIP